MTFILSTTSCNATSTVLTKFISGEMFIPETEAIGHCDAVLELQTL